MVDAAPPADRLYAEVFGGTAEDPRGEHLRPMLFVHGWLMNRRLWASTAGSDSLSKWSRVCVDLRGHGRSRMDVQEGFDAHIDDLVAYADAEGWDQFVLVGHSMGGAIAQHLAARMPERVKQLVLVAPVPMAGFPLPAEAHAQFASLAGDRDALEEFFRPQLVDVTQLEHTLAIANRCPPVTAKLTLDAWTGGAALPPGARVRVPTLILGGEHDPYLSPDVLRSEVLAKIDGAQLRVIDAAGHYPQLDRPEAVAEAIAEYLDT